MKILPLNNYQKQNKSEITFGHVTFIDKSVNNLETLGKKTVKSIAGVHGRSRTWYDLGSLDKFGVKRKCYAHNIGINGGTRSEWYYEGMDEDILNDLNKGKFKFSQIFGEHMVFGNHSDSGSKFGPCPSIKKNEILLFFRDGKGGKYIVTPDGMSKKNKKLFNVIMENLKKLVPSEDLAP